MIGHAPRCTLELVASRFTILIVAGTLGLWTWVADAQEAQGEGAAIVEEPFSERLKRRNPDAISELRESFLNAESKVEKQRLAALLTALEEGDEYFEYLATEARKTLARDVPFPLEIDADGRMLPKQLSNEFVEWAKSNSVDPHDAARQAMYELPGDLLILGISRDPRGKEILLKGLKSKNYLIAYQAAAALGRLGAVDAVPAVIAKAETIPGQLRSLLARALTLFDDEEAEEAAERLLGDPQLVAELLRQAQNERQQIEDDLLNLPR